MRTGKLNLIRIAIVVLAGLMIGVATAHASGQSPDNRSYYRGTGPPLAPTASPDDRSFSRATTISSPNGLSPDDRKFDRSTPVQPTSVSVRPRGFAWGDALIGGTFGLVLALLGAGAVAMGLHRRRGILRPA